MPRSWSRAQPALSDAVAFYCVTGWRAPKGRFATVFDALLVSESERLALRRRHRAELAAWVRGHRDCWAEARALAAEAAEGEAHAAQAPLGYRAPQGEHEDQHEAQHDQEDTA